MNGSCSSSWKSRRNFKQSLAGIAGDVLALEEDMAAVGRSSRLSRRDQGGLAAAGFADDAEILARQDVEGDAAHGLHLAVGGEGAAFAARGRCG